MRRRGLISSKREMDAAGIAQLYQSLSYPSASAFHKALRRRGISVRLADVEEFVKSRSERQVIAPPPKYDGHIVSFGVNHRWAADLIAFTSRPAKSNDGTYTHVLLVQDIFSRFLMARPLKSVSDTTAAFEEILKESEDRMVDADPHPQRLDTDGGPEFVNATFRALILRYKIEHVIRNPNDTQALATLDSAIGTVKRMMQRMRDAKGGSWLTNLSAAIHAYNNTEHGGIDAEPAHITDNDILSLKKEAAEELQENTELIRKRQTKLEKEGGYRAHVPKEGLKGLRRRIDANTWSREVHQVSRFPAPGIVEDTQGNRTLTKFAKPVPWDTSQLAEREPRRPPDDLEPYAKRLRDRIPARGYTFSRAARELKHIEGARDAMKMARLSFGQFVTKFPTMLRTHDGRVYSRTQQTLV